MVSLAAVEAALEAEQRLEYECLDTLNLYDSPTLEKLATQAIAHRHLRFVPPELNARSPVALPAVLCEDDYPGWVAVEDLDLLERAEEPYRAIALTAVEIRDRLPQVLAFAHAAMQQPNYYLWGGTVGPNYDCSGLVQTAFAAAGIWLPRDAYQQEAFVSTLAIHRGGLTVDAIALESLHPGDLIFFGSAERCTHVGLALGEKRYLHSSGKDQGRNGIGIDVLSEAGDVVSQTYFRQLRGAGRVLRSYQPGNGWQPRADQC